MRPRVSSALACRLAARHWRCAEPLTCTTLAGYDDTNLKLEGSDGAEYVFKAHNAADSAPAEQYAEAQNALLRRLAAAGIAAPAPLPVAEGGAGAATSDGYTLRIAAEDGRLHAVRLLTWLPGTLLVDAQQSAALYCQLGALLACVNTALQDWDWQATGVLRREHAWNLGHLAATYQRIRGDLAQLPGVDVPLLDRVVAHFHAATSAAGPGLRHCIIHSDANERNVLVDGAVAAAAAAAEQQALEAAQGTPAGGGNASPAAADTAAAPATEGQGLGGQDREAPLVTGLIDWGDACWQWLAAEPAIAMCYMMLLDCNAADPLPAGAALLAGYERHLPLLPAERRLLRTLAMGRLAQSLSLGAHSAAQQPDNAAYLLGTQKNGWRLLRLLWGMTDEQFLAAMHPCPAWLPHCRKA